MKLLAIDTSTDKASVALLLNDKLLHKEQGSQKTHAQFILPMIDALIAEAGIVLNQLDGIIFGCGPGSFTGLRIACSVAKGLAYAHDLDLFPVSSLATIAWSARKQVGDVPILAVLDARMQEMYWAYYAAGQFSATEQVAAVSEIHLPKAPSCVIAGVGIDEYWSNFSLAVKQQVNTQLIIYPEAAAMIELVKATSIKAVSVTEAQPVYVRNKVTS